MCINYFTWLFNFSLPGTDYKRAMYFHVIGRQDKEICIQLTMLKECCTRFCPVCFEGELNEEMNYEKWGEKSPKARTITRKIPEVPQNKGKDERFNLPEKITPAG